MQQALQSRLAGKKFHLQKVTMYTEENHLLINGNLLKQLHQAKQHHTQIRMYLENMLGHPARCTSRKPCTQGFRL